MRALENTNAKKTPTPHSSTGVVSGAIDAVESFCRVAAPLAGGVLLQSVSLEGPPRAGARCSVATNLYVMINMYK